MSMRYERSPSEEQKQIIEEARLEIPLKVVAGAGTGKTYALAHRFVWLVTERGLRADRILALTFSENAAAEMRSRIRRLLRLNGQPVPATLWVHTFHGFAVRVLRENAYAAGRNPEPVVLTEVEQALHLERLLDLVFAGEFAQIAALRPEKLAGLGVEKPAELRRILWELVSEAKDRGLLPEEFRKEARAQAERFWRAIPSAAQVHALGPEAGPELIIAGLAERMGLAGLAELSGESLPSGKTLEVRKLYYRKTRPVEKDPEAQLRLDLARQAELDLVEAAAAIYELYEGLLQSEGALDFSAMMTEAVQLLRDPALGLARRYREEFDYLLVDEFQDTSWGQLEMVRLLARPRRVRVTSPEGTQEADSYERLLVVGDQKQSIYGWRNARPGNVDELLPFGPQDTMEGRPIFRPLTESYRMNEPIAVVANRAGAAARPEDPPLTAGNPKVGRVVCPQTFVQAQTRQAQADEAGFIAAEIRRLREAGEVEDLSEIAILIRTRGRFRRLKLALEREGVPYQAQGGVGFFEHPLARDVIAWLQVAQDPGQDLYVSRLLTRPPYALDQRELLALLTRPGETGPRRRDASAARTLHRVVSGEDERPLEELEALGRERVAAWWARLEELRELGRQATAREVLDEVWRHSVQYVALTASEEKATPVIRATFEGVVDEISRQGPAPLDELVGALNLYLEREHQELPVVDQPGRGAVQIMTLHRAKGLGFEVVFLPAWFERAVYGPRYDATWGLLGAKVKGRDPKGLVYKMLRDLGATAEDDEGLRLAYVGITRARRVLYVTWARGEKRTEKPYPNPDYCGDLERPAASGTVGEAAEEERFRPRLPAPAAPREPRAPRRLQVSFTELKRLETCPLAWLLARQGPAGLPADEDTEVEGQGEAAEIGSRFHRFAAAYYRGADEDDPQALGEGLSEAGGKRLRALVEAFRGSEWARLEEEREVERPVYLALPAGETVASLRGVVDLLLPGSGRMVDFKTEARLDREKREDHALQMYLYREALQRETGAAPQPVIAHVRPGGVEAIALAEGELAAQAGRLERLLRELVAYAAGRETPEPRPGKACALCGFAVLCAGAERAGETAESAD